MEGRHARLTRMIRVGRIFLFRISHETNCVVAAAFSLSPARAAAVAATAAKSTQQEYTEVSQSVRRAKSAHNVC